MAASSECNESLPKGSEINESNRPKGSDTMSTDVFQRQSPRSAGRPRQDEHGKAILSETRRNQIRRAQKTYRLKREAIAQSTKARLAELEEKISETSESLSKLHNAAIEARLNVTHPEFFVRLNKIHNHLSSDLCDSHPASPTPTLYETGPPPNNYTNVEDASHIKCSSTDQIFGYQIASMINSGKQDITQETEWESFETLGTEKSLKLTPTSPGTSRQSSSYQTIQKIEWPLRCNTSYTYSFQESTFSRRLQRYCLEHAFRMFSDPRSDPLRVYQVFRLVPCIRDKEKMYPYFKRLVMGSCGDPLEVPGLPFYCIGGAGTHYPSVDISGKPAYPSNMRLPRRVLGILPVTNEPGSDCDTEALLKVCGFGGQWFDSVDVEGYLRDCGVNLEDFCLFPQVDINECHEYFSADTQLPEKSIATQNSGDDKQSRLRRTTVLGIEDMPRYTLDIESFFSKLVEGLVILGRVPGFRKSDVVAAFKAAIRSQAIS